MTSFGNLTCALAQKCSFEYAYSDLVREWILSGTSGVGVCSERNIGIGAMPPLKAATTAMPEEKGACAICGEMVYNNDQRCKTLDGET